MSAVPHFNGKRITERKRVPHPELTLRLPTDLAADAPNVERKIQTTVYDDVFAVISMGCLVIGGAFAFYALFGM